MPWSEPGLLAACAAGALGISAGGTAWAIDYARRRGMLDQPGERRSHAMATPRGGGIGLVIAMLPALGMLGWWRDEPAWWSMALGLLLVAGAGWWDDHRPLPIAVRLGAHVGAGLALAWGLHLQGAGVAAVLAAACLGFLPFNLPPARIFLGDVGSGALGYAMAMLLAGGVATLPAATWPLLVLPPLAMLADSGLTLCWRMATGQPWWKPHVQHLFQRCSRRWGHARVTTAYAVWTCVAIGIMLCTQGSRMPVTLLVVAVMALLWLLAWFRMHRRGAATTEGFGT